MLKFKQTYEKRKNQIQMLCLFNNCLIFCGVVVTLVARMKKRFYHDHYPMDVFISFVIEVFGCFHQQVNIFLHR
jgi:hypothetical protein